MDGIFREFLPKNKSSGLTSADDPCTERAIDRTDVPRPGATRVRVDTATAEGSFGRATGNGADEWVWFGHCGESCALIGSDLTKVWWELCAGSIDTAGQRKSTHAPNSSREPWSSA